MTAELSNGLAQGLWKPNRDRSKRIEAIVKFICGAFAAVSIVTTFGIVATLFSETLTFFGEVPLWQFLTDGKWTPLFASKQFGIFVLISATVMISVISIAVALPLGLLSAVCLSEYATPKVRKFLKPVLEILASLGMI